MASPDKKAFLLRLPPDVWAQLERLAASELRSVNGQVEFLLREALARRTGTSVGVAPSTSAEEAPESAQRPDASRRGAQKRSRRGSAER